MQWTLPAAFSESGFQQQLFVYYGDTSYFYQRDGKYLVKTKTQLAKNGVHGGFTFWFETIATIPVAFPTTHTTLPFLLGHPAKRTGRAEMVSHLQQGKHPSWRRIILTGVNQNWNNMCADCHTTNF